jgi:hypothetical protein
MAIVAGDLESCRRLLEESRQVVEPLGELYYESSNLAHRARLALIEERPDDAIDFSSRGDPPR